MLRPEPGEVQRHVGAKIVGDPLAKVTNIFFAVVPRRDDEIGQLDPDAFALHDLQGFEHGRERCRRHSPVVIFRDPFKIDICRVDVGRDLEQGFLIDVTGGDPNIQKFLFMGEACGVIRVFIKDDRVRIRVGNAFRSRKDCLADDFLRRKIIVMRFLRRALRNLPVLAELAMQVASGGGDRERSRLRQDVEQRFFLDWINVDRARVAVNEGLQFSVEMNAHAAVAALAVGQAAGSRAQLAFNGFRHRFLEFLPVLGFARSDPGVLKCIPDLCRIDGHFGFRGACG